MRCGPSAVVVCLHSRVPATIVSVTPVAVERDSRTYKHGASLARLGYRSVVIEGATSRGLGDQLPFELRSLQRAPVASGALGRGPGQPRKTGLLRQVADRLPPEVRAAVRVARAVTRYMYDYGLSPLSKLPRGDLYYLHSYYLYPAVRAWSLFTGAPIVYDAHDCYSALRSAALGPTAAHTPADRLLERFNLAVERACIDHAASVVTVSDGVADLIHQRFGRRPLVVRNTQCAQNIQPVRARRNPRGVAGAASAQRQHRQSPPRRSGLHRTVRSLVMTSRPLSASPL
jgi:Glycosyltransferase Family 4